MQEKDEIRDPETYAIIGAAMEAHRTLGHGFLEAVYQEAFEHELSFANIPHNREVEFEICYKGKRLTPYYKVDFVCYGSTLVELKALRNLSSVEESLVLNYLKASGLSKGLLINFGAPSLQYKRYIRSSN